MTITQERPNCPFHQWIKIDQWRLLKNWCIVDTLRLKKNCDTVEFAESLRLPWILCIFVCVQPFSNTLFEVPFPLPTPGPLGHRAQQLKAITMYEIRVLHQAIPRTWRPLRQTYSGRRARDARRPSHSASRIQSSGAIVTSRPWIQLTFGTRYGMIFHQCAHYLNLTLQSLRWMKCDQQIVQWTMHGKLRS